MIAFSLLATARTTQIAPPPQCNPCPWVR